jgi:hypothetical protein
MNDGGSFDHRMPLGRKQVYRRWCLLRYDEYEHNVPPINYMRVPKTQAWWIDECIYHWASKAQV